MNQNQVCVGEDGGRCGRGSAKGTSLSSTSHKASLAWAKDNTLPFKPDLVLTSEMFAKEIEEEDQMPRTEPRVNAGLRC